MIQRMTVIPIRPRLSHKVRLRCDRRTGRYLLLYPERGIELNETATEIVRLCTGAWTVDDIVRELAAAHVETSPAAIERDVQGFLTALARRGLLQGLS